MKILFLTLYPDVAASPRYRVTQFVPYLESRGVSCTVACPLTATEWDTLTGPNRRHRPFWYHARETVRRAGHILGARRYDVVFVQKAIMTAYVRGFPEWLRARARRLVYDMDDAVHLAPPHPLPAICRPIEDRGQIQRLFAMADLVLAGNAWLAETAKQAGARRVEHFPTVVDTDRFTPGPPPSVFRIGWIGNASTTTCLAPAAGALAAMRDSVRLVGADAARVPFAGSEITPWSLAHEVETIRSFSAGIMPQPAEPWMRGKCALKALQYMACGVPCVATPFGAVLEFMRHGENGLFADDTTAWLDAFARLRDPALRKRIGEAGRETVEKHYALCNAVPRLYDLLRSLP